MNAICHRELMGQANVFILSFIKRFPYISKDEAIFFLRSKFNFLSFWTMIVYDGFFITFVHLMSNMESQYMVRIVFLKILIVMPF